jgi:histidinol-phosphate aminotransferase
MFVKSMKSFNQFTRQALLERVGGYVNKNKSLEEEIVRLKQKYNLEKIYRFDLGENVDGFSPKVNQFLQNLSNNEVLFSKLHEYPEITHVSLRERLGAIFNIPRQNIVISAGLDSILDLITRVFFESNDLFLAPVPGFFLYESYSKRMGAIPIFLQLSEDDNFLWTEKTFQQFKELIIRCRPKITWLSNPNNPTGQFIPEKMLLEIIQLTNSYNIYVVVDEAYHEFIGSPSDSAAKYIMKYNNLMVLRTFSKALGLAGIRLGYLMCSDDDIIEALLLHRHHFPITQLSLNIARVAIKDTDFINTTQKNTIIRKEILFKNLDSLSSFKYIASHSNIFMLKSKVLTALELDKCLKQHGIITSHLNITGIDHNNYLRVTVRTQEDNYFLYQVCKQIDEEISQMMPDFHKKDEKKLIAVQ